MVINKIVFLATERQPNPNEVDYWVDLNADPYGRIIKYYNGEEWLSIAATDKLDPAQYYTKSQVDQNIQDALRNVDTLISVPISVLQNQIDDINFNVGDLAERVSTCETNIDTHEQRLDDISSIETKTIEDLQ